jgi:hypothetical protein
MDQPEEIEVMRAEILLGRECAAFFNTDPGRYVKARANETVLKAIEELKTVRADDKDRIAQIQLEIKSADNALSWLQDAINNGESAMQQLKILADEEERY